MNDKIDFRKVEINELEQYHRIRLECLKNHPQNFGSLYEEELQSASYKFDRIIVEKSESNFLMGAFENEKLVGICGFKQESRNKTRHNGELSGMFVMSEFKGQKIGAGLLNATIKLAFTIPNLEQIILAVASKNQTAKNLYTKVGFVEYGRLKNYFKHNGDYETQVFMALTREIYDATKL